MKLFRAKNDDLVTVRFERHYAITEAGALKRAGFGGREAVKGCLDEWTLVVRSYVDFEQIVGTTAAEVGVLSRPWAADLV
jgi:hypothetical protein